MTVATINGDREISGAMAQIMGCEQIMPGDEPSYQVCKLIYLLHPLGGKMVDSPVKLAMSRPREITVGDLFLQEVVDAFVDEHKRTRVDDCIKQHAQIRRTYGLAVTVVGCVGKRPNVPLTDEDLYKGKLFFNVLDPLNVAGSISIDQDPNSPTFQKWTNVAVAGKAYHRSRAVVTMHETPVYIAWTTSAYSFSGRSVFQRALYPLQSFLQTMVTDDMISRKAGLLIAKIHPTGSIVDQLMAAAGAIKRRLLQQGATNGVLQISAGTKVMDAEEIDSLNLQNIDGAGTFARGNILKNIATAGDMPAWFLENETLTSGFGEGEQDAENILRYIDGVRDDLQPMYDFHDPITMRRAWNPEFFEALKGKYPDLLGKLDYNQAFYRWSNSFKATWPNLMKEPESKAVDREKVRLEAIISLVEVLAPILDPENLATFLTWVEAAVNDNRALFPKELHLDVDLIEEQAITKATMALEAGADDQGDDQPSKPRPMTLKDHAVLRDRLFGMLGELRDRRTAA